MIAVSCITKFHSFNLAEQLHRQKVLSNLYTSYAYKKNTIGRHFTNRIDKENIPPHLIHTNLLVAGGLKTYSNPLFWNNIFDEWVSKKIRQEKNTKAFIGWSGMSLKSIEAGKSVGMTTILERGSSHIENQIEILEEEYKKFNKKFSRNQAIIDKEKQEYELADYISVPSMFAAKSFFQKGFAKEKIWVNNFGSSQFFQVEEEIIPPQKPFRILYLGSITIQKGLKYLFDAMDQLPVHSFELWIIGTVSQEMSEYINHRKKSNWKFFGFINHYELPKIITQCHIAVQPSLQEGLSMVIPQILACGLPVIATTNTGGEDIIQQGKDGFIIPIRDSQAILQKIMYFKEDFPFLENLRKQVLKQERRTKTWNDYGDSYLRMIRKHTIFE